MEAVIAIFNAAKVPMEYEVVDMGKWVFDKGFSNGMTPEATRAFIAAELDKWVPIVRATGARVD